MKKEDVAPKIYELGDVVITKKGKHHTDLNPENRALGIITECSYNDPNNQWDYAIGKIKGYQEPYKLAWWDDDEIERILWSSPIRGIRSDKLMKNITDQYMKED